MTNKPPTPRVRTSPPATAKFYILGPISLWGAQLLLSTAPRDFGGPTLEVNLLIGNTLNALFGLGCLFCLYHEIRKQGRVSIPSIIGTGMIAALIALNLSLSEQTISEQDLDDWIYTYDPYFPRPEEAPILSSYNSMEEWATAVLLRGAGNSSMRSDATLKGALGYEKARSQNGEWIAYMLRAGIISHDQINQDWIQSQKDELTRRLDYERERYPEFDAPLTGMHGNGGRYLALIQADLLSEQEREQLVKKVVAGLHCEVRAEAPEGWGNSSRAAREENPLWLRDVVGGVELLIALDASQEISDAEDLALEAMKMCYREEEGSGRAGFVMYTKRGTPISVNHQYLIGGGETSALYLMGVYGTPDFVDVPAFHKHLIDKSVGKARDDNYPEGSLDADNYLAAAARFRLEELHPEL